MGEWDNNPGEFECAIMGELMEDPVKLPSGHVCERKNIERHILSTPNDPFSRQPLTEDMLVSDTQLKVKIGVEEGAEKQEQQVVSQCLVSCAVPSCSNYEL